MTGPTQGLCTAVAQISLSASPSTIRIRKQSYEDTQQRESQCSGDSTGQKLALGAPVSEKEEEEISRGKKEKREWREGAERRRKMRKML